MMRQTFTKSINQSLNTIGLNECSNTSPTIVTPFPMNNPINCCNRTRYFSITFKQINILVMTTLSISVVREPITHLKSFTSLFHIFERLEWILSSRLLLLILISLTIWLSIIRTHSLLRAEIDVERVQHFFVNQSHNTSQLTSMTWRGHPISLLDSKHRWAICFSTFLTSSHHCRSFTTPLTLSHRRFISRRLEFAFPCTRA